MYFYSIIKKINDLKQELEQIPLSALEKDILKSKVSELYLLLFEKQEAGQPLQNEIPVEKKTAAFVPDTTINSTQQSPEQETQPKQPLNVDYKSLVDAFLVKEPAKQHPTEDQSLLSKISQAKITDLKRSIAMNDRFIFIKELFNNEFDTYNRCINDLNSCENIEPAEQYLSQLKKQFEWDDENETVQYFNSLIRRKFLPNFFAHR